MCLIFFLAGIPVLYRVIKDNAKPKVSFHWKHNIVEDELSSPLQAIILRFLTPSQKNPFFGNFIHNNKGGFTFIVSSRRFDQFLTKK